MASSIHFHPGKHFDQTTSSYLLLLHPTTPSSQLLLLTNVPTMALLHRKQDIARCMLRSDTEAWFRDEPIDQRDRDLINAAHVEWLDYTQGSFVRKIVRCLKEHTIYILPTSSLVSHESRGEFQRCVYRVGLPDQHILTLS